MKGVTSQERNGAVYWYARIDGQRAYCGQGKEGERLAKVARKKWDVKQYETREASAGLKVKRPKLKTVAKVADWYIELPAVQELKSYGRKISAIKHVIDFFGKKSTSRIEPDVQEKYRALRAAQGASSGTIDYEIRQLQAMMTLAVKRRMADRETAPREYIVKREIIPRRIVTDAEYAKLLKHADPYFKDLLVCAWETGMRSAEICNLRASQVFLDLQHISGVTVDYIALGKHDTKTGHGRIIPISAELKEVLERRMPKRGLIFLNENGQPYGRQMIADRLMRLCKRADVPYGDKAIEHNQRVGIVFHSFRHTRVSKWVEMGYSDEIIRKASGHRSLEAYQRYVHIDAPTVMRLVNPSAVEKRYNKVVSI
jgi:integrase